MKNEHLSHMCMYTYRDASSMHALVDARFAQNIFGVNYSSLYMFLARVESERERETEKTQNNL